MDISPRRIFTKAGQLVDIGLADKSAHFCNARVFAVCQLERNIVAAVLFSQFFADLIRVLSHGAEFVHIECAAPFTHALLYVENRKAVLDGNSYSYYEHGQKKDHKRDERGGNIRASFKYADIAAPPFLAALFFFALNVSAISVLFIFSLFPGGRSAGYVDYISFLKYSIVRSSPSSRHIAGLQPPSSAFARDISAFLLVGSSLGRGI